MECLTQSLDYMQNFKCCRRQATYGSSGIEDNSPGNQSCYCSYPTTGRPHSQGEHCYLIEKETCNKSFLLELSRNRWFQHLLLCLLIPSNLFIYFLKCGLDLSSVKVHLASTSVYIFIQGSSLFMHLTVK